MARTAAKGSTDIGTLNSAECLSRALHGLGQVEEAQDLLEDVYHRLVARFGQEHTRSLVAGNDLGEILLDRLSDDAEETALAESQSAEVNTRVLNGLQTERNLLHRRNRRSQSASTSSVESLLTKRYIEDMARRHPAFGALFPIYLPWTSPRITRSLNSRQGQNSQLGLFEETALEHPYLQKLAKAVLIVSSVFKGFETRLRADQNSMPDAFQFAEQLGPQLLRLINSP